MTMNETLTMAAIMLAPAFFSLLAMAAFGTPIVALLGEIAAKTKSRVFYDKYGQQTATLGIILLILIMIVDAAAVGIAYAKFPQRIMQVINPASPFINVFIALGAFILLSFLYFLTWKKLRNAKTLHLVMGICAATAATACIAIAVPLKLTSSLPINIAQAQPGLGTQSMIWPIATMYAIFAVSAAAGLSGCYLLTRRKKDDFGRDYYTFSLKLAARWAALPMIAFLGCQGWLFAVLPNAIRTMTLGTPLGMVWSAVIGLGIICTVIWLLIARSVTPLQLKGLNVLSNVMLWLLHTMNCILFVNFMSMF